MDVRTALLAGALALAGTVVRAEELQWTVSGIANPIPPNTAAGGPFFVSFDLNTQSGQLTPFFSNGYLGTLEATNLAVTNYLQIVGGQTFYSAHGSTAEMLFAGFISCCYDWTGGPGAPSGFSFGWDNVVGPQLTEAQYLALKDPLAAMLLGWSGTTTGCCGGLDPGPWSPGLARMIITAVPTPGPLSIFLAGLVALVVSWRRKQYSSVLEPLPPGALLAP
jgi:hypothetical protein